MLPQKSFYLIRHGETVMNALKLCCGGGVDTVLNDTGRAQARDAANILAALDENLRPDLIVHSGMNRTRETAGILNQSLGLEMIEVPELREHMLGEWEKKPWAEALPHIRANVKPEGGESAEEFALRVGTALSGVLNAHEDRRVMVVAHGGTFHSIQRLYGRLRDAHIPNCDLHNFLPEAAYTPMPWKIDRFNMRETQAIRVSSPFCPSQPD